MCGITATIALGQGSKTNGHVKKVDNSPLRKELEESLKAIAHRGPDASGVWISDDGAIGESYTILEG